MDVGLVPESSSEVAEERTYTEEPGSTSAQRPTADVQRRSDSTGRTMAPWARQARPEVSPTGWRARAQRLEPIDGF